MGAGRFSALILFQKPVVTTPGGFRTITWTDDFQDWADASRQGVSATFVIRYRKTPDGNEINASTERIIWDGRIWTMNEASPVYDRRLKELTINCDLSQLIETTDLDSETTEYVNDVPVIGPPS